MAHELILTFHGLGEPPRSVGDPERMVWIPLEWFEAIIDAPLNHAVSVSFDDGNSSDIEHALPALMRRGLTARFFPLAGRIGQQGYLDAADIAGLSAAGMRIGSHGIHHRDWRKLSDSALQEELTSSRGALAAIIDADVTEAACPFGSYDRRVLRALRTAGYGRVFTSDGGVNATGAWLSPRTTVDRSRPLRYWIDLARAGKRGRPARLRLHKRLIKRLR
jgi:peptidoglycan/xylan/chitin deacetylase (PgdA/CDA1 family)